MAVSPFLPTVAKLRASQDCKSRQCIWTRASKKNNASEQCSRTISDGGKTRKLLQCLDDAEDTRAALLNLAALQLCGRSHRVKHIGVVVDEWLKEIEEGHLKPAISAASTNQLKSSCASAPAPAPASYQSRVGNSRRTRSVTSTISKFSGLEATPSVIRQTLQIDEGEKLTCHGRARKGRCTQPLARQACDRIDTTVRSLAISCIKPLDQEYITDLLTELAGLVLCRGYHQDQAPSLSMQWLPKLVDLAISTEFDTQNTHCDEEAPNLHNQGTPKHHLHTSNFDRATTPTINDSPQSSISSFWSRNVESHFTTPGTSPQRPTSRELQANSPLSHKNSAAQRSESLYDDLDIKDPTTTFQNDSVIRKLFTQQSHKSSTASLRVSHFESPKQTILEFVPFPTKGMQQELRAMRDVISRPLSEQDQRFGCIYGFQREDNGYIKVGVAKDVEARMQQWANSCHYTPKVILKISVSHAFRVERLIQLHLQGARFRETLVNGLCNSGKGCPRKHQEWFKIGIERLRKVFAVWKRFMESEPYDEKYSLKPCWQKHLKNPDLCLNPDPWLHWLERILDGNSVIAVKREEANDELKKVKIEGKSGVKGSENSTTIIKEQEIKVEPGETEDEDGIRALGRQYRLRFKSDKGALKEDSSKGIIDTILDSTVNVASLVGAAAA
ncbi:hypothetical protein B0O99DRAFT_684830 [Bisporella sp. PMI_857]|nr:hypothetical protein B0O99DRAFT_684830 [Bisporella sp. PMI_857]